jgi:hypothetical protein
LTWRPAKSNQDAAGQWGGKENFRAGADRGNTRRSLSYSGGIGPFLTRLRLS